MNILGDVTHDRIGTAAEAVVESAVCHHAEVLRLIDDHVASLADTVGFLDPLVNVSECCQVIEIEFIFRNGYRFAF